MDLMFKILCMAILLIPFMLNKRGKTALKVASGTLFIVLAPVWLVGTIVVAALTILMITQSIKEIRRNAEKHLDE